MNAVLATLFVGLEALDERCLYTKKGLMTCWQSELTRTAVSVQFRDFIAW